MSVLIMPENMLFYGEIDQKFTLLALTNFTSGFDFMTNKGWRLNLTLGHWLLPCAPVDERNCPAHDVQMPPHSRLLQNLKVKNKLGDCYSGSPKYSPCISTQLNGRSLYVPAMSNYEKQNKIDVNQKLYISSRTVGNQYVFVHIYSETSGHEMETRIYRSNHTI